MKFINQVKKYGAGAAISATALAPFAANAELPAAAQGAFTEMSGDFTTLFGYGFTALIVVVTAMIGWKYTKKLGSKI